jgi:ferredoxin
MGLKKYDEDGTRACPVPDLFALDDDGTRTLREIAEDEYRPDPLGGQLRAVAEEAVDMRPVQAIRFLDDKSGDAA